MTKEREEGSTVAEAEGKLTMVAEQAESCGVYGCTLDPEDHSLREGAEEVWHFNEVDRVHWPVLTEEAEANRAALEEFERQEAQRLEATRLELEQVKHRMTRLQQHRSRWSLSLEDVFFIHRMMGQATAFSGDFKPVD